MNFCWISIGYSSLEGKQEPSQWKFIAFCLYFHPSLPLCPYYKYHK
jgi:hypothetical protein